MSLDIPSIIHDFFTGSQIPLTLSDPRLPDDPLILANEPFYRMTGYTAAEALGANCRFMQGEGTQKSSRNTIKGDFAASRDTKVLIRIGSQFEVPSINRAQEFETHAATLRKGLDSINDSGEIARNQLVQTGELIGASVKSLLMARLENLRAS